MRRAELPDLLAFRARLLRLGVVADRYGEDLDGWPAGVGPVADGCRRPGVENLALDLHEGVSAASARTGEAERIAA